jgi:branched-chain amino acid transport system substrate-binding protein
MGKQPATLKGNDMKAENHPKNRAHRTSRRQFTQLISASVGALAAGRPTLGRADDVATIRIASIQALTGSGSGPGIRSRDGVIFAADELNGKGGYTDAAGKKYRYEIVNSDMANDPKQAVTLFRQAAEDPMVIASLGPNNSVGYVPNVPVSEQLKMPLISNGSGAIIRQWSPFAYRVNPVASVASPIMLRKVVEVANVKRLAIIYDQTQDMQVSDAQFCRDLQKEIGYQLVADETFRSGDRDFSVQLAKTRAAKPDAVWVASQPNEGPNIVLQLRSLGIDVPLITGTGNFYDPTYWDNANGGTLGCYTWLGSDLASAELKPFLDAYNARFPQQATLASTFGYNSMMALHHALQEAGTADRLKVQQVLSDFDYTSPLGTRIAFKNPPHGDNLKPTVIIVRITGRTTYAVV